MNERSTQIQDKAKQKNRLVSTIIPVFNRPGMVRRAIESVLEQTYRPIEVIVVDDGSFDHTADTLMRMQAEHPEVTVLKQVNSGPGVAREYGRQHARGAFIQYLDSDDILLPEKFSLQVTALNDNLTAGVCYGKTERVKVGMAREGVAWKRTGEKIDAMFPSFIESRWWGTSTPLYRRKLLDEAGPWEPLSNEEDWEYDCRIAAMDTKLAYVDEFVSIQYEHNSHLSSGGGSDSIKLADRCDARNKMYQSIKASNLYLPNDSMQHFSKSIFHLARQCAEAGMGERAKKMVRLAARANGRKTWKHRVFSISAKIVGWRQAAKFAKLFE